MWQKFWSYLTFKKQEGANNDSYLRMMHKINRISIIMFLVGMVIVLMKIFK